MYGTASLSFLGIAVSVLFCSLLIRDKHQPLSAVLSAAGIILLLLSVIHELKDITETVKGIIAFVPSAAGYVTLMLRVLGITLLTQLISDICRDNGESALAGATETAAKVIVIAMVLPLFSSVISIINGLVK